MLTAEDLASERAICTALAAANEQRAIAAMDAATLAAYRWSWTRRAGYRARRIASNARLYGPLSTNQKAFLVKLHRAAITTKSRAVKQELNGAARICTPKR